MIYSTTTGQGDPLLLIAGFSMDSSCWDALLFHLNFKVTTFDNRGCGRSDILDTPYTIEMMADDAITLLNEKKSHILGHSMGGAIAQTIAAKRPELVNRLILYNSFTKLSPVARFVQHTMRHLFEKGMPREEMFEIILPWIFSPSLFEDEEQLDLLRKRFAENPYPQPLLGYKRQMEALDAFDSRSWIEKIQAPTLILQGECDKLCSVSDGEELAKGIENCHLHLMPCTGHTVIPSEAEKFAQLITSFLKNTV